eukprot:2739048-Rhodomonas_salina.1
MNLPNGVSNRRLTGLSQCGQNLHKLPSSRDARADGLLRFGGARTVTCSARGENRTVLSGNINAQPETQREFPRFGSGLESQRLRPPMQH